MHLANAGFTSAGDGFVVRSRCSVAALSSLVDGSGNGQALIPDVTGWPVEGDAGDARRRSGRRVGFMLLLEGDEEYTSAHSKTGMGSCLLFSSLHPSSCLFPPLLHVAHFGL